MPNTVIGLFDDLRTAQRVEHDLEEADFPHDRVFLAEAKTLAERQGDQAEARTPGGSLFTGDFMSTLAEHGVPRDKAEFYAEGIRRGGSAVILFDLEEDAAEKAASILRQHRPVDPARRLEAYHEYGYGGYNAAASPFSDEEAASERNRHADYHYGDDVAVVYVM